MFHFTTDFGIKNELEEDVMQKLVEEIGDMTLEEYHEAEHKDAVFKEMYIPRTLQEVSLEDIVRMQRDGIEIAFDKLTGLKLDKEQAEKNLLERKQKTTNKEESEAATEEEK